MGDPLQVYRDAITKHVHTVCFDRNLDSTSKVNTEADCRIERFLPQLVELTKMVGSNDPARFEAVFEERICPQCGNRDGLGICRVQEQAECCLYRYLPLIYDAIHSVQAEPS